MRKFKTWNEKLIGRLARRVTGAGNSIPLHFVSDNSCPKIVGKSYYWTTPGGKLVRYPSAYGWRTVYHPSTRCLSVGKLWDRTLRCPLGCSFSFDGGLGLCVIRDSDGMDYHPTAEDLQSRSFRGRVRRGMAQNYVKRMAAKKEEKVFATQAKNTWVTLQDSIAAGNCVEGSLAFAERRLKIPREEILAGGQWLYKVRAKRLLETKEPRALAAVRKAWMRETTISI